MIRGWLLSPALPDKPSIILKEYVKKCPEIPVLSDYRLSPAEGFWVNFPFCPLPTSPEPRASPSKLREELLGVRDMMTPHEWRRGVKCCEDLENGATGYQKISLPPTEVPNTSSSYDHGEMLTDEIASWVKAGIVAGPFDFPPPKWL